MEYSNDMQDVYKNIEESNLGKKRKVLIVFDDMIANMINNKKFNPVVNELFIRSRKLNISIAFITQSYFKVPKDVRLNSTHLFIMKIPNKRELNQIAINHSSDVDFKDFMKIYKKCTAEPYSFLVKDTTLPLFDPLRFRKNLLTLLEIRLKMKNYNAILIEKLQKYQLYQQAKLISMNILLVKKYCHLINSKQLNKLNLIILLWEKLLGNKQKQLKIKGKNKLLL